MNCEKCGKITGDIIVGDLTNMSKELSVICADCRVDHQEVEQDGSFKSYHRVPIDPRKVANQINPDISCDFCNCPDPQWLYDLRMEPMVFDGHRIDLGKRWVTCDACAKDADENSPLGTTLRMGVMGDVTSIMQIHGTVMENISNKRGYVRSNEDGVIKQL